jgi:hypothetical protein
VDFYSLNLVARLCMIYYIGIRGHLWGAVKAQFGNLLNKL